jgi:Domain of unknown function (DUF6431)
MVLIVGPDPGVVERRLLAGELACPACGGGLAPWAHARVRGVRLREGETRVRPRRARCRACPRTHVLLPDVLLLRRQHGVEVIGAALRALLGGQPRRRVAVGAGLALSTVRGWARRLAERAEDIRGHFTALALWLDPLGAPIRPSASPAADALEAVAAAAVAAAARWPAMPLWRFAAAASGGRLLSNTGSLFPAPWARASVPGVASRRAGRHEDGGRAPP